MSLPIFHKNKWLTLFVFFSQQTTTHPHPDARLDRQHPGKLVFVVGDGEEAGGLWILLMVIFGLFVNFFGSFLLVAGVVGFFWCFLLILGQMGIFEVGIWCFLLILGQMSIFEVGIFVDRWCGYSRRISTDPTGPFSRSRQIAGSRRRTPALSPYTVYNIRKKKK